MITIGVTYEIVTPESAEHGEADEHGWEKETEQWEPGMLREVLEDFCSYHVESSCYPFQPGAWWIAYNTDEGTREYYKTGAEKSLSLHINGVTRATLRRINRILTGN